MPSLWLSIALLTLVTLVLMFWPWFRGRRIAGASQVATNVAIYRGEREQVELDFREGRLSAPERDNALAEIDSRIIEDVGRTPAAGDDVSAGSFRAWPPAAMIAGLVSVAAFSIYLALGNPFGPPAGLAAPSGAPHSAGGDAALPAANDPEMQRLVDQLAERLKQSPNDLKGWVLLGRTSLAMRRFDVAADALSRATELAPNDPELYTDLAEVLIEQSNGSLAGRPVELARKALSIDANNTRALSLLASAAWSAGDAKQSLALWQKILAQLPPESEDAKQVQQIVAQISGAASGAAAGSASASAAAAAPDGAAAGAPDRAAAGAPAGARTGPAASGSASAAAGQAVPGPMAALPPAHPPIDGGAASAAAASPRTPGAAKPDSAGAGESRAAQAGAPGAAITGTVSVKADLMAKLTGSDTLYIFARPAEGPRMPLAVIRTGAGTFPFKFRLDDSQAMSGQTLSSVASVVIEARVSKTGQAIAQSGDLSGRSQPVAPGANGVAVVVDTVVP